MEKKMRKLVSVLSLLMMSLFIIPSNTPALASGGDIGIRITIGGHRAFCRHRYVRPGFRVYLSQYCNVSPVNIEDGYFYDSLVFDNQCGCYYDPYEIQESCGNFVWPFHIVEIDRFRRNHVRVFPRVWNDRERGDFERHDRGFDRGRVVDRNRGRNEGRPQTYQTPTPRETKERVRLYQQGERQRQVVPTPRQQNNPGRVQQGRPQQANPGRAQQQQQKQQGKAEKRGKGN
jgi:hypothetical protein